MGDMVKKCWDLSIANNLRKGSNNLLTNKEAVISCLIGDYTVNDIAKHLCRSKNTVKFHIKNIKKKCHCETQTRLGAVLQSFVINHPQDCIQKGSKRSH